MSKLPTARSLAPFCLIHRKLVNNSKQSEQAKGAEQIEFEINAAAARAKALQLSRNKT